MLHKQNIVSIIDKDVVVSSILWEGRENYLDVIMDIWF